MRQSFRYVLAILLGLTIGIFIGSPVLNYFSGIIAADHFEAANKISIRDVLKGQNLTLKYEGSGSVSLMSLAPSLELWSQNKTYSVSRWGYYSGNDLNAYILVTGPANDGKTYGCEIVRMAWNELHVTAPSGEYTFPRLTQGGVQQGYLSLEFIP